MYLDGPPTSVVPVSMAAYESDPDGIDIDRPLVVRANEYDTVSYDDPLK